MRIFNEEKTREVIPNYELGYTRPDTIIVEHHDAVPFKVIKSVEEIAEELIREGKIVNRRSDGNLYLTTEVFENGGNLEEVIEPIVQEEKEAYDDYEDVLVFVLYTTAELAQRRIAKLKAELQRTDYQAIKFAEGELSAEEYAVTKALRRMWREEINALEAKIAEEGEA